MVLHWHCRKPLFGTFIVYMEIKLTSKATSLFRGFSHHWQAWKVYVTKKNNLFIFGIFEVQNNIMLHWLSLCGQKHLDILHMKESLVLKWHKGEEIMTEISFGGELSLIEHCQNASFPYFITQCCWVWTNFLSSYDYSVSHDFCFHRPNEPSPPCRPVSTECPFLA